MSLRNEILVTCAFIFGVSFVMGSLAARSSVSDARKISEAEHRAIDLELDQIQQDVDDLQRRVDSMDVRLTRIEELVEQMTVTVEEDPS
jgi:ribosomal protein S1